MYKWERQELGHSCEGTVEFKFSHISLIGFPALLYISTA